MMSLQKSIPGWTAALVIVFLAGCGGGPNVVAVTGVLTYKGKPVTNAYVDFVPEKGRPSWGQTDEQGRFKLDYDPQRNGALVGKHKVSVRMRATTQAETEAVMLGKAVPMDKDLKEFFEKYSMAQSKREVVIEGTTR